jgi:hypothetical protein
MISFKNYLLEQEKNLIRVNPSKLGGMVGSGIKYIPKNKETTSSEAKRKLPTKAAIPAIPSEPPIPKTMEDEIRQRGGFQIISTQGKPETPSRYVDLNKFRAAAQKRGIPSNAVEPLIKHGIVKQI